VLNCSSEKLYQFSLHCQSVSANFCTPYQCSFSLLQIWYAKCYFILIYFDYYLGWTFWYACLLAFCVSSMSLPTFLLRLFVFFLSFYKYLNISRLLAFILINAEYSFPRLLFVLSFVIFYNTDLYFFNVVSRSVFLLGFPFAMFRKTFLFLCYINIQLNALVF
jgi:hypothetical protein